MPFSGNVYTPPTGAENALPGQIVQSATWNAIHTDIASALTQVMSQLTASVTNRNILAANGSFEVWQRGAGASASMAQAASTTAYTSDRWYLTTKSNQASVISAATGLSNASQLACKIIRNAAQTGTGTMIFGYPLDTQEIYRMRGAKVTISFLVKTGANWSPASGTLNATLYVGTGAVGKRSSFTGETTVLAIATNLAVSSATTAVSGTSSAVVPITSTQAEIQFTWDPVGTAGADDSVTIDDVQIEVNLSDDDWTTTDYDRIPFEDMLAMCKRFYQKTFPYSVAPAQAGGLPGSLAYVSSPNQLVNIYWQYPVEMRTTASNVTYNPNGAAATWQDVTVTTSIAVSLDTSAPGPKGILIYGTTSTATAGISHLIYIQAQADSSI